MSLHSLESPRDGRRVLLSERMVNELRMLAIQGFVAVPKRGVEVGGILFGEARSTDVHLAAYEEVSCEHRYGPSYALSQDDQARLKELLGGCNGRQLPIVGFFRSFTSRDPVIEAADEVLVREQFPKGVFVWLMLQPLSAENCVASLRFFCDGQLLPEPEDPPMAFDARQLPVVEPVREPPDAEPPIAQASEPPAPLAFAPPLEIVAPLGMTPPSRPFRLDLPHSRPIRQAGEFNSRPWRWWAVAAIFLLSLLGGALFAKLWRAAPRQERWTELHLDARPAGDRLEITWDGAVPRALHATKGLLAVTDGPTQREIPLDGDQIRSGKYAYAPSTANVGLRLVLYANGQGAAGDAMRVAMLPADMLKPAAVPAGDAERATHTQRAPAAPPQTRVPAKAVPPSIVHEVQPTIPDGIRSRITTEVVIPVEVRVNEQGQVVRAVSKVRTTDSVSRYLAEQAQKAAREWRFTPARTQSGELVAANKTLRFVFTP